MKMFLAPVPDSLVLPPLRNYLVKTELSISLRLQHMKCEVLLSKVLAVLVCADGPPVPLLLSKSGNSAGMTQDQQMTKSSNSVLVPFMLSTSCQNCVYWQTNKSKEGSCVWSFTTDLCSVNARLEQLDNRCDHRCGQPGCKHDSH